LMMRCAVKNLRLIPVMLPGVNALPNEACLFAGIKYVQFKNSLNDESSINEIVRALERTRSEAATRTETKSSPTPVLDDQEIEAQSQEMEALLDSRKSLQECDPAKILFIKNVKNPEKWAYSLDWMQYPKSRIFELWWPKRRRRGVQLPAKGDLMILSQRARVTHVVEFLDDEVREVDHGFFRWVKAVWMAEQDDWYQLPHQDEVLKFHLILMDGNTHAFQGPGFRKFHDAWSNLEDFQKYIHSRLTRP
ncbi:MAG TPA: hypothetical protein ACFE0H_10165, partial [Elainellaceae cyanobacterium]